MDYDPLKKSETVLNHLNILRRCDASVEIGLSHITRSLVLTKKLKEQWHHVTFTVKTPSIHIYVNEDNK